MTAALLAAALAWIAPSTERIDYAHPDKYVALVPSLGDAASIRRAAAELDGKTGQAKLRAIARWIDRRFRFDDKTPNVWRDFDGRVKEGVLASCADNAVLFGTLARAAGIPTVWVKTMDADWIREFARDPKHFAGTWRGHVFLELFLDGKWRLFDASERRLYDDYDPRARLLPGNRVAYDKGDDPKALTLSLDWEPWKEQTRAHLAQFDVSKHPVAGGRPLVRSLHVVADRPYWQWIEARGAALGVPFVSGFNVDFARRLPASAGHWLVLTVVGARNPLPAEYRDRYSPLSSLQIEEALELRPSGRADRALADGTRVVLLYARDEAAMRSEVERLTLDE